MTRNRVFFSLLLVAANIWAQANGKLQIHFIDVGQGDGAILISPGGQVVAFDIGRDMVSQNCDKPVAYYAQLGIRQIDYLFVSHYHEDHLGCVPNILASAGAGQVEDRGQSYASTFYAAYAAATMGKRATPRVGDMFVLDGASPNPVTIEVLAVNANGAATTDEDALSLSARISYGGFRAEIGGDLTGENADGYLDVESGVAGAAGKLDVYKAHHHCSNSSSNATWLALTRPTIAIVSAGDGNTYGHPTADCLERLHSAGARTYWTEQGAGATPVPGWDTISGTAVVNVDLAAMQYTVAYGGRTDVYTIGGGAGGGAAPAAPAPATPTYAWSKLSGEYHYISCAYVKSISPDNLETGNVPPAGKTLHHDCPTQQ
ncbi:MAG: ComEC/Rec2 family competence protein [Bryobacteraceae bacterium]